MKDELRERLSETEGESQPGDRFIAATIQKTGMTRESREQECFTDRGRYNQRTIGECFYCYCSSDGIDFERRKERETVVSKCCPQRQSINGIKQMEGQKKMYQRMISCCKERAQRETDIIGSSLTIAAEFLMMFN